MPATPPLPSFQALKAIAEEKRQDWETLRRAGRLHGAAYAAILAAEAVLKAKVCKHLFLGELPRDLWMHDILRLARFAGLQEEVAHGTPVGRNLQELHAFLTDSQFGDIRYRDPSHVIPQILVDLEAWVFTPPHGVLPWTWRLL